MECFFTKGYDEEEKRLREERKEQKKRDRKIDKNNRKDFQEEQKIIQLLLLGTGESGKSTISKQMRIIHLKGYTDKEKLEKVPAIRKNVRDSIACITAAMHEDKLKIAFEIQGNSELAVRVRDWAADDGDDFDYNDEFFDIVTELWRDSGVQKSYSRSNEYQLIDCAKYFLDRVEEIRKNGYMPTVQDILRCRIITNNISCIDFIIQDNKSEVQFRVFDVGGQKGERKKWIQLFSNCTAILFLADSSSFDQTLKEDVWSASPRNRLIEGFDTFHQVWLNRYLQNVSLLLFINKIDRLQEKIVNGKSLASMFDANCEELRRSRASSLAEQRPQCSCAQPGQQQQQSCQSCSGSNHHDDNNHNHNHHHKKSKDKEMFVNVNEIIAFHERDFKDTTKRPSNNEEYEFLEAYAATETAEGSAASKGHKKTLSAAMKSSSVHPDTIKSAVIIKNIFNDITNMKPKSTPKYEYTYHTMRYYYTCAVNTNNVQKVLDGCRAFIIERHLERFGIL